MAKLYEFVTATLTVNFSATSQTGNAGIKLEVDDRPDGANGGNTSFKPGDTVYILQFVDENVEVKPNFPQANAGSVSSAGRATKSIDENITFSNSDTASLGYPPSGAVTMTWLGRVVELNSSTGAVSAYSGPVPEVSYSGLTIPDNRKVIGVLNCKYDSVGDLCKLSVEKQTAIDFKEVLVFTVGQVTDVL